MARGSGRKTGSRTFGTVHKLPSGRYRAMYYGKDKRRYSAPTTFTNKHDASAWLALVEADMIRKAWTPPEAKSSTKLTFGAYAEQWLTQRELKQRTRELYRKLLDQHLLPAFGSMFIASITADDVRAWHADFGRSTPTQRSKAYGLLRTIMSTATADGKISANPVAIRGAGNVQRVHKITPASKQEIEKITQAIPQQYQAMILLAAWCALRFGELTELRRQDVVLDPDKQRGVIRVQRAVVRTKDGFMVTTPKSDAGVRDVAIPPHLVERIAEHLAAHVGPEQGALLFPAAHGGHLAQSTLHGHFDTARKAANRPDLRFHDLRHSGAVLAAQGGATLAELMGRLGHSSPAMAMKYQHVAAGRDQQIAEKMSKLADEDKL